MTKNPPKPSLIKEGQLTPVSDTAGVEVKICAPPWFDERKNYRINNAPARTASIDFPGADLNFVARVLYAESSGSAQLKDKAERTKEKSAILNVMHFRIGRRGYPTNQYVATSFTMVGTASGQFTSVKDLATKKPSKKLVETDTAVASELPSASCNDLTEALLAVRAFVDGGPSAEYNFDNFRSNRARGPGIAIGGTRFWLSNPGLEFFKHMP